MTFVPSGEAKPGFIFIYEGAYMKCDGCKYQKICHNLKPKSAYRVVKTKDKIVNCKILSEKMQLVEVNIAETKIAVEPKFAIGGATIKVKPQECGLVQCERFDECVSHVIEYEEKYRITGVVESFSCPESGKPLVTVSILPQRKSLI
ncbi:MAG: UPF0179 family protein [Candidatus Bathyarchaeota archaeon]